MGVLIRGMEMPTSCYDCNCFIRDSDGSDYCCLLMLDITDKGKLDDDCPLIEVPTPHGPLVDSNRLIYIGLHLMHTAKNDDIANGVKWLWQYIIEAPAIISAEEGE